MQTQIFRLKIFFLILLMGFTVSCKKTNEAGNENNNSTSGYYVKFKVDGVQKEFKSALQATTTDNSVGSNGLYQATVISLKDVASPGTLSMFISIQSQTPIVINRTYTNISLTESPVDALLIYTNEIGSNYDSIEPDIAVNTTVKVTLSELTSTYIKGTFKGKVYRLSTSDFHEITDGEFKVLIK